MHTQLEMQDDGVEDGDATREGEKIYKARTHKQKIMIVNSF